MRLASILMAFILSISLYASGFEKHIKYRGFNVELTSQKPLTTGENTLLLKLSKKSKEFSPKDLKVKFFMPAMPGMPYMESFAKVSPLDNKKFKLNVKLPMKGTWQLHIFVTDKKGKKYRIKSSVSF